jgi:hypothetical protein
MKPSRPINIVRFRGPRKSFRVCEKSFVGNGGGIFEEVVRTLVKHNNKAHTHLMGLANYGVL